VLFGLRQVHTEVARDVEVRLDPPRLSVVSTHHYINLGGSEAIVYRVTPADASSGVRVGDVEYPGFPLTGSASAGATATDPSLRLAFFALRWDQPITTPMALYARDEAGNAAEAQFERRVFPKPARTSRIELNDAFLERVVPAILAGTKEVAPQGSLIEQFVVINSDLRRLNAERIASFARETSPEMLWQGAVFHPFTKSSAESAFADRRTYLYQGREVDRQVHLGFDLASYANTPIVAANRGTVVFAGELGIYGNAVILDHGMGLQSLYAHLSGIDVPVGAMVEKKQTLGRSGMTGMAGGDHLHFTMLLHGQMVTPVEWWDAHWIEDRILRKLR
jgi:murein DD-endopeptidase MepM/ murein hydrolase activator NlpD